MKKLLTLSFVFVYCISMLSAQQTFSSQDPAYIENVQAGETALKAKEYKSCLDFYATAFELKQTSYLSTMRAAACAFKDENKELLELYLQRAFEISWSGSKQVFDDYEEFDFLQGSDFAKMVKQRWEKGAKAAGIDLPLMLEMQDIRISDQAQRRHMGEISEKYGWQSPQMDSLWTIQSHSDSVNTLRITELIDEKGYPGKSMVGESQASTAFLVIQHAELPVQEKYLPILIAAAEAEELRWSSVALLIDRVSMRQGKKQIYGSQVGRDPETGEHFFAPIENPHQIDEKRAEVGLGPLQDYADNWNIKWDPDKHIARHKDK